MKEVAYIQNIKIEYLFFSKSLKFFARAFGARDLSY